MAGNEFDPSIKPKMSVKRYIEHLKNVHEMSEQAGIPKGIDALFKKARYPAISADGSNYSGSQHVPLEPELETVDILTKTKIRAYEDF